MKKVIIVGDPGYFPDSFVWFKERGYELYYVELKDRFPWLKGDKDMLIGIGAVNIPVDELNQLYGKLDKETLVISGPSFSGDIKSLKGRQDSCQNSVERLEAVYNLSKYNHDHGCGAKFVLVFNGDTGFGSQKMVDFFNEKIQYVDALMFDNDLLKEFILQNSSVARKKIHFIGWLETPLKRYVIHQTQKPKHEIISLGRCISAFDEILINRLGLPITFFPKGGVKCTLSNLLKKRIAKILGRPDGYQLGTFKRLKKVFKHRKKFQKYEAARAFGLSHMHDVFWGAVEKFHNNKEYYFSLEGQQIPNSADTQKELYYPFVNNPNKEACYMMYGIIPLISHAENSYYKTLLEKKMAILIQNREDFKKALAMSDQEIQEYRDNIYANQDVFTFDHVGEMLVKLLDN